MNKQHIVLDNFVLDKRSDAFSSMEIVDTITKQINEKKGKYTVIGLFGAYGEGKSAIVKAIDNSKELKGSMLEIDVWKYAVTDIEDALHRMYNMEYDINTLFGKLKAMTFAITNKINPKFKIEDVRVGLPTPPSGLKGDIFTYNHNVHKEASLNLVYQGVKDFLKHQKTVSFICFENLDRCSIEKKIELISSIHKWQDWFSMPILVALDPHAVDEQKKYFEDLIKKAFHTSHYVKQKTKIDIQSFMKKKENLDDNIIEYINSIYPITPREIYYIKNVYISKKTAKANKSKALMSILQVEYRALYHQLSKNPFYLAHYIDNAKGDIENDSYGELSYKPKDIKRINRLFLKYYRSFEKFDIFKEINDLSPLFKISDRLKNKKFTEIRDRDIGEFKNIIQLMIEAHNFYEIKEIFLEILRHLQKLYNIDIKLQRLKWKTGRITLKGWQYQDSKLYNKFTINKVKNSILLLSFNKKEMVEILFIDNQNDNNYYDNNCYDNNCYERYFNISDFNTNTIKTILHKSANEFNPIVTENLSKFILHIIDEDSIKIYGEEFAQIFIKHHKLFISFCKIQTDKTKLANFIYKIMTQELLDHILFSEIDILFETYPYLIDAINNLTESISNNDYKYYKEKNLNHLIKNEIVIKGIIKNQKIDKYVEILKLYEEKYDYKDFKIAHYIESSNINPISKLKLYHQAILMIKDTQSISNQHINIFEDVVYLLAQIFLQEDNEDNREDKIKALFIIYDESFINQIEFNEFSPILAQIYAKAIEEIHYHKEYKRFFKYSPKIIFNYILEKDYPLIYEKFDYQDFAKPILEKSIQDEKFFNFVKYLYENELLDKWYNINEDETHRLLKEIGVN